MAQLKWRGLVPWRRFVEGMKLRYSEANQLRERVLTKKAWSRWHETTLKRERERESLALRHYETTLLRRSIAAWIMVRARVFVLLLPVYRIAGNIGGN